MAEGEELPKVLTFAEAEILVPAMVENRRSQNVRKIKSSMIARQSIDV